MIHLAIIRADELREMDASTMAGKLRELSLELSIERGTVAAGGRPTNPGRIREIRKTIARIHTVATQRKIDLATEDVKLASAPAPKPSGKKPEKKEEKKKEEGAKEQAAGKKEKDGAGEEKHAERKPAEKKAKAAENAKPLKAVE